MIGAGGLYLFAIAYRGNATDRYNACLQDAKIGLLESGGNYKWFDNAVAQCAKQYRIDRNNGR